MSSNNAIRKAVRLALYYRSARHRGQLRTDIRLPRSRMTLLRRLPLPVVVSYVATSSRPARFKRWMRN